MADIFRKTKGLKLAQLLESRTKAELKDIVQILELPGYTGLRKNEVVEKLNADLPEEFNFLLSHMDGLEYEVLQYLSSEGGAVQADNLTNSMGERLASLGMVFMVMIDDTEMFVIPEELAAIFRESDTEEFFEIIKRNQEVVLLAQGLLNRYGVLETKVLFDMICSYMNMSIDEETLFMVLRVSEAVYGIIEVGVSYCSHSFCEDRRSVVIGARELGNLEYKSFTHRQILEYSIQDYYEVTPALVRFWEFIKKHFDIAEKTLNYRTVFLLFQLAADKSIDEIVEYLLKGFKAIPRNALEEFSKIIADLNNTTGKWALKGYSPEEILEIEKNGGLPDEGAEKPKLTLIKGRNLKPCPCGSGKLYKDCCGRK
jgi:hypothetical protein